MNCKPGDMAMVIGGTKGTQIGKIVTCIRVLNLGEHRAHPKLGPVWLIDIELSWDSPTSGHHWRPWIPDIHLLPINPKGESVETLDEAIV